MSRTKNYMRMFSQSFCVFVVFSLSILSGFATSPTTKVIVNIEEASLGHNQPMEENIDSVVFVYGEDEENRVLHQNYTKKYQVELGDDFHKTRVKNINDCEVSGGAVSISGEVVISNTNCRIFIAKESATKERIEEKTHNKPAESGIIKKFHATPSIFEESFDAFIEIKKPSNVELLFFDIEGLVLHKSSPFYLRANELKQISYSFTGLIPGAIFVKIRVLDEGVEKSIRLVKK